MAIEETQTNHTWIKQTILLILSVDCNIVVASMEVNTTKTASIYQTIHQVINSKQWVFIRSYLLVQSSAVYVYPEGIIIFPSKKSGALIRKSARPDPALAEVLIQLFSDLRKFYR